MNVFEKITKNSEIIVNGEKKENIGNHFELDENDHSYKANLVFDGRCYVELDFKVDENDIDFIHARGNLIELFKDNEKTIELYVRSKELINIESNNQTFKIILYGESIQAALTLRESDFLNKRLSNPSQLENVYSSHQDIRYHFVKAEEEKLKNHLIIVFSAFSTEYIYNFNYIETLKEFKTNKLFILDDFDAKGSYYLGKDSNFSIESAVISLILNKCAEHNISMNNIITLGSSKGGYSALYFGVKYSFGNIITLAPSLFLGTFLKKHHPEMLEYILGGSTYADEMYLNNLIYKLFNNNEGYKPNIKIMVGTKDSRKESHIKPFINYLNSKEYPYDYDLIEGVDHSQLKYFAPEYFKVQVAKILNIPNIPEMYLTDINFKIEDNIAKINIDAIGENLEYAFYWYCDNIVIKKEFYSKSKYAELPIESSGAYRVRIFLRNADKEIITKTSQTIRV